MELTKLQNSRGQIWLNVGSGAYALKEFINLDSSIYLTLMPLYPVLKVLLRPGHLNIIEQYRDATKQARFLRHDCRKPLKFPDESVDHIVCSHFLEHVYPSEVDRIISDFYRVLKRGGTLHIIVPNLEDLITTYNAQRDGKEASSAADALIQGTILSHQQPPTLMYRALELLGYEGLQHRWMYDKASMASRLTSTGFHLLELNQSPSAAVRLDDGSGSAHLLGEKL